MSALLVMLITGAADLEALMEQAAHALAAGDLEAAATALAQVLANDADHAAALEAAALVASERGAFNEARGHLERLLGLDPNNDDARLALAQVLWHAGEPQAAQSRLGEVLARHPQHEPALALRRQLGEGRQGGQPPRASRLRPQARVGVAALIDTNLSLDPDGVERASTAATLAQLEASGGLVGPTLSAFVLLSSAIPLRDAAVLGEVAPTRVTAEVVARYPAAPFEAAVDLRYEELFGNAFSTRLQRTVAPSLWGTYKLTPTHEARLGIGVDLRQPVAAFGSASVMPKVSLRDDLRIGSLSLTSSLAGRMSRSTGSTSTDAPLRTDFDEAALALTAGFAISDALTLLAVAEGQGRRFRDDPTAGELKETTLFGLAGARYTFEALELHAEYAYTQNLSHRRYAYDRHQVSVGVRAWYE